MTKKMKRPISNITQDSIKPSLSNAVEFYTNKNREAHKCIQERDEYIDYLESKLSNEKPQQALPVVPELVAGAIESIPDHYSSFEAISLINAKVNALPEENEDWLPVYNWLCEGIENQDVFALAFITRKYQVEKPKLFFLKNTLTHEYLYRKYKTSLGEQSYCKGTDGKPLDYCLFTLDEIESMNTGSYEQIEVAE